MKTESQTTVSSATAQGSVLPGILFRLSLLVGPEAVIMKFLAHSPVAMLIAGITVLALWLSVDIGPFKAPSTAAIRPVAAKPAKPAMGEYVRNLTKVTWWSQLFFRTIIVLAMFHSKLHI